MERSFEPELLDTERFPDAVVARAYRDLTRLHRFLGHTPALIRAIRRDPLPVHRVLDIGCAHGAVLAEIRDTARRGSDRGGIYGRRPNAVVPVVAVDAVRDRLPDADVAISICLAHHLSETELAELIRNVGQLLASRFILLDLVRHWVSSRVVSRLCRAILLPVASVGWGDLGPPRLHSRGARACGSRGRACASGIRSPVGYKPDSRYHVRSG